MDFIQNDRDWLKWRSEGLGASDAPVYISQKGISYSKYNTRKKLLEEKITQKSKDKKNTFISRFGHEAEAYARKLTELYLSFQHFFPIVLPSICGESDEIPYMRSSLDGFSEKLKLPWECKLTGKKKFEMLLSRKCPNDFYCQTQHQMFVSSTKKLLLTGILLSFENRKPIINYQNRVNIFIKRDQKFIDDILLPKAKEFWSEVLEGRKACQKNI